MSLRSNVLDLILTDAANANRMNDALREALLSALLTALAKRAPEMTPAEIFETIERLSATQKFDQYEKMLRVLESVGNQPAAPSPDVPREEKKVVAKKEPAYATRSKRR